MVYNIINELQTCAFRRGQIKNSLYYDFFIPDYEILRMPFRDC